MVDAPAAARREAMRARRQRSGHMSSGRWSAYVTRHFPGPGRELLAEHFDAEVHDDTEPPAPEEFARHVAEKDAVIIYGDEISAATIAGAPRLKVIADQWGGARVDLAAAKARGIVVTTGGYD